MHLYSYENARALNRLGLVNRIRNNKSSNRYGKNVHELRDVFRSLWEKSPATYSVAEYVMGHVVDPLGYNKAHRDENWTRKEYLKAVPYLNIISSGRAFGRVDESEVERLRLQIQQMEAEKQGEQLTITQLSEMVNQLMKKVENLERTN